MKKKNNQSCFWAVWSKHPDCDDEIVAIYHNDELETAQIVCAELRAECPDTRYWVDAYFEELITV